MTSSPLPPLRIEDLEIEDQPETAIIGRHEDVDMGAQNIDRAFLLGTLEQVVAAVLEFLAKTALQVEQDVPVIRVWRHSQGPSPSGFSMLN